ncbi:MAG: hypothetical protein WDM91_01545 [Rhizomicrobium sp.]
MSAAPNTANNLHISDLRWIVAGSILAAFFLVVFGMVLILISALQLQHSIEGLPPDVAKGVTIGKVREDVATLDGREKLQASRAAELDSTHDKLAGFDAEMRAAVTKISAAERSAEHQVAAILLRYPDLAKIGIALPSDTGTSGFSRSVQDRLDGMLNDLIAKAAGGNIPGAQVDSFSREVRVALAPAIDSFNTADAQWRQDYNSSQLATGREKELATPLPDLPTLFKNDQYAGVLEDFRAYEVFGTSVFKVVWLPNAMLVLLLAIFMGMLGSLIHLTRRVVLEKCFATTGEMLSRIGLGAAVALALFFFSAAGVLAMSQNSASQSGDHAMSPYLISFLGITAGYLSDRVTAWMREIGENTFSLKSAEEPARWAVGLKAEMARQNLTSQTLAAAIGETVSDLDDWQALTKQVPSAAQKALAYYLRVRPNTLFTDVPP